MPPCSSYYKLSLGPYVRNPGFRFHFTHRRSWRIINKHVKQLVSVYQTAVFP